MRICMHVCECAHACVCVCVCVGERERERERGESYTKHFSDISTTVLHPIITVNISANIPFSLHLPLIIDKKKEHFPKKEIVLYYT